MNETKTTITTSRTCMGAPATVSHNCTTARLSALGSSYPCNVNQRVFCADTMSYYHTPEISCVCYFTDAIEARTPRRSDDQLSVAPHSEAYTVSVVLGGRVNFFGTVQKRAEHGLEKNGTRTTILLFYYYYSTHILHIILAICLHSH